MKYIKRYSLGFSTNLTSQSPGPICLPEAFRLLGVLVDFYDGPGDLEYVVYMEVETDDENPKTVPYEMCVASHKVPDDFVYQGTGNAGQVLFHVYVKKVVDDG